MERYKFKFISRSLKEQFAISKRPVWVDTLTGVVYLRPPQQNRMYFC